MDQRKQNQTPFRLSTATENTMLEIVAIHATNDDPGFFARLQEMGLVPGTPVSISHFVPFGGAIAVTCRGAQIGMRLSEAERIEVRRL